ncbi:helix-turn-helix domain-containing protein [Frondihabitans peucedani]|uniref:ArsR family transcriptional regulator n=1 Tax=Frondihabitans peucedani TaxID=598626 RepID=A0ABP8E316_9MICO
MPRPENLMRHTPDEVAHFQEMLTSPSRVLVLRALLQEPRTVADLYDVVKPSMSKPSMFNALAELRDRGYTEDDAPEGTRRRGPGVKHWAKQSVVTRELAQLLEYFLG